MPRSDVRILGEEQFVEVGRRLSSSELNGLRRELNAQLRLAATPAKPLVAGSLREGLPRGGGLAAAIAGGLKVNVAVHQLGTTVGLRLEVEDGDYDLAGLDEGEIAHPTFGHEPYVRQAITKGLISKPLEKLKPVLHRAVSTAMDRTSHRITR